MKALTSGKKIPRYGAMHSPYLTLIHMGMNIIIKGLILTYIIGKPCQML